MGLKVTDRYYGHISETVINVSGTIIMWDVPVTTDRTVLANIPDIVLREDLPTDRHWYTRRFQR